MKHKFLARLIRRSPAVVSLSSDGAAGGDDIPATAALRLGVVSVIVPTFNRAQQAERAARSVLAQDYPDRELVVIDDGSSDDTCARLEAIGLAVHRQANRGPSAARNAGLRLARGEFVAWLDSDDAWDPPFLSRAMRGLTTTGAGFVFANWRGAGPSPGAAYADRFARAPFRDPRLDRRVGEWRAMTPRDTRALFVRHSAAPSSSFVIRRSLVARGWDERFRIGEDALFLLDVILDTGCSAAYGLEPAWTKWSDNTNLWDRSPGTDAGLLAEEEIRFKRAILERYDARLHPAEKLALRRQLAQLHFDAGHREAVRGHLADARRWYARSLALWPHWRPFAALLRSIRTDHGRKALP